MMLRGLGQFASMVGTTAYTWATTPAPSSIQQFASLLIKKDPSALSIFFYWLQMQHPLMRDLKEKLAELVFELQTQLQKTPDNRFINFLLSITALHIKNSVRESPAYYYSVGLEEKDLLCMVAHFLDLYQQKKQIPPSLSGEIKCILDKNSTVHLDVLPIDIAWYFLGKLYYTRQEWNVSYLCFEKAQTMLPIAYLNGLYGFYSQLQTIHTLCITLNKILIRLKKGHDHITLFIEERKKSQEQSVLEGFFLRYSEEIEKVFSEDVLLTLQQISTKIFGINEEINNNIMVSFEENLSMEAQHAFSKLNIHPNTIKKINKTLALLQNYCSTFSVILSRLIDKFGPISIPSYNMFLIIRNYLVFHTETPLNRTYKQEVLSFFHVFKQDLHSCATSHLLDSIINDGNQLLIPLFPDNLLHISLMINVTEENLANYVTAIEEEESLFRHTIGSLYETIEHLLYTKPSNAVKSLSTIPTFIDLQMSAFENFPCAQENTFPIELIQFVEAKLSEHAQNKSLLWNRLSSSLPSFTHYLNISKGRDELQAWVKLCHENRFILEEMPVVTGLIAILIQRENRIYANNRGYEQDPTNQTNQLFKSIIDFLLEHYSKVNLSTLPKGLSETIKKFQILREQHEYELFDDAAEIRAYTTNSRALLETDIHFATLESDSGSEQDNILEKRSCTKSCSL